jgi:hypothetical protein
MPSTWSSAAALPSRHLRTRLALLSALGLAACSASNDKSGIQGTGDGDGNNHQGSDGGMHHVLGDGDNGDGDNGDGDSHPLRDGGAGSGTDVVDQCGTDNPAGLSADDLAKLKAGGSADGMRWLYPYEGTVFPRGLQPPALMWDGKNGNAVYVHIESKRFKYDGCLKPSAPGRVSVPADVWEKAEQVSGGEPDPVTVSVTELASGAAHGPLSEKIVIARANLSGSIFYNSYNAGGGGDSQGAVLRIKPGQDAEVFSRSDTCNGCHSVSGNGTRLIDMDWISRLNPITGSVYAVTPDTAAMPTPKSANAPSASFVGLYPDGSVYVSTAAKDDVGPEIQGTTGFGSTVPDEDSELFETDTGKVISGTGIPKTAMMPTFSPDGSLLTFNDYALGKGHSLVLMDYKNSTHAATNSRTVYTDQNSFLGWPFVLPDNHALLFAYGKPNPGNSDCTPGFFDIPPASCDARYFDGRGVGITMDVEQGPLSDLSIVDIASSKAYPLAQAVGFRTQADLDADKTYLPFGKDDVHQVYFPVVSPVASGGYFWVFFDSYRNYGNMGRSRQLWGTALTIAPDGKYKADPSHPAFYIGGQDFNTANHRAFTALDPCKEDGGSCKSGIDCCGGHCEFLPGDEFHEHGMCSPPVDHCAAENEKCKVDTDCCAPPDGGDPYQCINGFCATVGPIL